MSNAQNDRELDNIDIEFREKYQRALDFMNYFKVDSADFVLDTLLDQIIGSKYENTPFELHVKTRKAEALEKDNEGDLALLAFQEVKEKAIKTKVWEVVARASINLALVYEKIGKKEDCIQNLRTAQVVLTKHPELSHLYPFFCVRISSYHRIYENQDSAIHYANECIRTYEAYDDLVQAADGYLLMTLLSEKEGTDAQIRYAKKAVNLFKKIENHLGHGYMLTNTSKLYYKKGEYKKALMYNDSSILAAQRAFDGGLHEYSALYTAYKFRGEIYSQLNQHDSSSYYIKKGYELQSLHIREESQDKVLAMDAKYKNNQKVQKILEQEKLLRSAKIQRRLLSIIFGLVTLFTIGLFLFYNNLKKAKRQTEIQAEQIRKTNSELSKALDRQIVLQGEMHHRVKNNLQVIISLLELQKEELEDQDAIDNIDSMSRRIYSMAAIHNLLYQKEEMEFVKLTDYIENLCFHFSNFSIKEQKPEFKIHVEDISLNLETAMPIGIIITELLTNSLKYARVENQTLKITIDIKQKGESLIILYKDNGPGFESEEVKAKSKGLGFYILDSMTRQLQGNIKRKNNDGATYEIYLLEKNKRIE